MFFVTAEQSFLPFSFTLISSVSDPDVSGFFCRSGFGF